jgi:protein ImuB
LGRLPVHILFAAATDKPSEQLLETFERWGIRSLRALAALPEIALSARLGQPGVHLHQLARGTVSRTLVPYEASPVFQEAIELEHPIVLLEPLAFLLSRLLDQICTRLSARALATQELRLELELAQGWVDDAADNGRQRSSAFRRNLHLPVPLLDPKIFLKILQLDLKAHPPGAPIIKIQLSAEPVRPRAAQAGLFVPPSPEPENLELTLARISGIVGEGNVGCAELLDTHRPERFRMQKFSVAEATGRQVQPPVSETSRKGAVTALRIFRPPLRATVSMRVGTPLRIACDKRKDLQGEIVWTAGPWRSSGDWWDQQGWARDEWDIALETASGVALYRLVRDLLSGKWFVEGTYD